MAGKSFSVWVNIGGKVLPSLTGAINQTDKSFARLAKNITRHTKSVKTAASELSGAMKGVAGIAAAGGIAFGVKHALGAGANLAHEIQQLKNAGRAANEVAEAMAAANKTMRDLPTTTLAENLAIIKETTGAFGDFHHAIENLGFNAKLGGVMKNVLGDKAGDTSEMFNKLVRAFEIRGTANDAHTYQREAGELAKSMIFSGGKVTADEFLNFAQQANPAIKNLSERFLTKIAPSLIQELGGDRAGTSLSAFRSTIMGKARDKKQAAEWQALGLIDPKQVIGGKDGPMGWKAGAIKGTNLAITDPLKWAEEVLIPALQKKGVKTDDQLELSKSLATMFRNQNANRFAEAITQAKDRTRLHKDEGLINQVHSVDQIYDDNLKKDPKAGLEALKSSTESFMEALTSPLMAPAAEAMTSIAKGIGTLTSALVEHPTFAGVAAGVGVALAGLAAIKFLEMSVGIIRLTGALAGLAAQLGASGALGGAAAGAKAGGVVAANDNAGGKKVNGGFGMGPLMFASGALSAAANAPKTPEETMKNAAALDGMVRGVLPSFLTKFFTPIEAEATGAGTKAGENIKSGLESFDLTGAGKQLGEQGKNGLVSVDYRGAGAQAGQQIVAGFKAATTGGGGGGLGGATGPGGIAGARAGGGPVRGGLPYLVGEQGPEIFMPGVSGAIGTNGAYRAIANAGRLPTGGANAAALAAAEGRGGTVTIHKGGHTITVQVDARGADAQAVGIEAERAVRRVLARLESDQRGNLSD